MRPFDTFPAGLTHQIRALSVTYQSRPAGVESTNLMNNLLNARHGIEVEFTSIDWSPCGIYPGTHSLLTLYLLSHSLTHSLAYTGASSLLSCLSEDGSLALFTLSNDVVAKCTLNSSYKCDRCSKVIVTHSLTHLLTYLLTYSLTHSLTHSPTHSLTHLLTHLLTY